MHFSLCSYILSGLPETLVMQELHRKSCFLSGFPFLSLDEINVKKFRIRSDRRPDSGRLTPEPPSIMKCALNQCLI